MSKFPTTAPVETFVKGMRLVDDEYEFYRVDAVTTRIVVISREDGGPMGAGCSVSHAFAKAMYKAVIE
jgi:hypothetical protein